MHLRLHDDEDVDDDNGINYINKRQKEREQSSERKGKQVTQAEWGGGKKTEKDPIRCHTNPIFRFSWASQTI